MSEAEERYRALMEYANDAIIMGDAEHGGAIIDVNPRACELLGRRREELIGMPGMEMHPPALREAYGKLFDEHIRAGGVKSVELIMRHRDGHDIPVLASAVVVEVAGRKVIQGIFRDNREIKQVEAAQQASERNLKSIVEGLPVAAAVTRPEDGRLWYVNEQAAQMFALPPGNREGLQIAGFYRDPADRTIIGESVRRFGRVEGFDVRLKRADGSPFWAEVSVQPILYNGHDAWLTTLQDIEGRKRFDEAVRASERKYRSLFDNMLEGFAHCRMIFDDDGTPQDFIYLDVNEKFGELTGLHDVIGKPVSEAIPGIRESNPELFGVYGRVAAGGDPERFETYIEQLEIWFSISVYSPQPDHFVAVFDNITKRKRAEIRMREESEFRRVLIEAAAEGICMWRMIEAFPYTEFAVWNRRMQEMTGYTMQQINERGWYQTLYPTPETQAGSRERMATVAAGGSIHGFEAEVVTRTGQGRVLRISSVPVTLEGGQTWVLAMMEDVTEHRELEANYRQMQKIEALGTLVGGIAHDFNNILAGMLGNIYLAQTFAEERPQVLEKLEVAEALGFQAADRIGQLLTFARKGQVDMQPLELNGFLAGNFSRGMFSLPENIHLRRQFCDDALPIRGDRTQIQQVLMNLLSNAADALAGRPNPSVSIRLSRFIPDTHFRGAHPELSGDAFAHLSIEDSGTGIRPQAIERIFEPFFTTKEVGKGTGLGLATVYSIVQGHGGVLEVESWPDVGTTFHIYLPLIHSGQLREPVRETPEVVRGNGELILVADDEAGLRNSIAEVLRRLGYRVLLAADGEEALAHFRQQEGIALVILDVVMPKLGGPEVARQMRRTRSALPVIFSTGYDVDNSLPMMDKVAAGNILTKPFRIQTLAAKIHELLSAR